MYTKRHKSNKNHVGHGPPLKGPKPKGGLKKQVGHKDSKSPSGDRIGVKKLSGPLNYQMHPEKPEPDDRPRNTRPSGHLPVAQKKADRRKELLKKLGHRGI